MTRSRATLLVVGIACLAYTSAFGGVFQFDDYGVIVDNPAVHSWSGWLADLGGLRPVVKLANTIDWTSGLGVFGFHLVNVAIHAANAALVYRLFARFVGRNAALIAALLFAVHPALTEAVTYISGRSTSLEATFYLGSLLAYLHGRDAGSKWWLYVVSPLLFALAFFTKEIAVTLPFALVLVELTGPARPGAARAQVVHWLMLAGCGAVLIAHRSYAASMAYSFEVRSVHDNVLTQIEGVWYLASKLAWPSHLDIDPALPVVSTWSWTLAAKAFVLVVAGVVGLANLRRRPWLGLGIVWFFLHLAPTNSLVPRRDVVNEREVYLAACGVFLVAGVVLARFGAKLRSGLVVAILVALVVVTTVRNRDYRSEVALWERATSDAPTNARAFNNLGYAYELEGEPLAARRAFEEALRLRPDYPKARNNLLGLESR
jgi:hypothetical protein